MTALAAPAVRRAHYPCFDGLRTVAVISAMLQHVGFVSAYGGRDSFGSHLVRHLEIGPAIFFMISGYLLYDAFTRAAFRGEPAQAVRSFYWRRALRIFPAYWLAFAALSSAWFGLHGVNSASELLRYLTLTHIYTRATFFGGIQQSYTLAVEITFYLLLPAYAALTRRLAAGRDADARLRIELLAVGALYGAGVGWRALAYAGVFPDFSEHWLLGYLDVFALGMGLAALAAWSATTGRPARRVEALAARPDVCALLAIGCYLIVTLALGIPFGAAFVTGPRAFARNALQGLCAFFLLVPAAFGDQTRGVLRRVLQWSPIVFVGTVSYGVYLWHEGVLLKARDGTASWLLSGNFGGRFLPMFVVTLAGSLVIASISFEALERPVLRWKDGIRFRLRRTRPVAA